MTTELEDFVTKINSNVFYKEFTFDKNEFGPKGSRKELADNVILLDDLLFVIQMKERNPNEIKSEKEENEWFENKVLKIAKHQIKESVEFFSNYSEIKVKNIRNQQIDISKVNLEGINKIIIYNPNSNLISQSNKSIKFYESKKAGNIHIFNIEDYYNICKFLITPTELDEYLKFRERIYFKHKEIIKLYPEQYILGHFLNTDDESIIRNEYIESLNKLVVDTDKFDMSNILNKFSDRIRLEEQKNSTDYHSILKEIAKLKRYELLQFKKRFDLMITAVNSSVFSFPYRFANYRTDCGFVFIPLTPDKVQYWENGLSNLTTMYKYKRKLSKCLGVIVYKTGEYFDFNWAYINYEWSYDKEIEEAVEKEPEIYRNGEMIKVERYKFNE
jgi:hypothetical protein